MNTYAQKQSPYPSTRRIQAMAMSGSRATVTPIKKPKKGDRVHVNTSPGSQPPYLVLARVETCHKDGTYTVGLHTGPHIRVATDKLRHVR